MPPAQWQDENAEGEHHWKGAPRAAFPSYQFSVETGMGLNLAIPIQGVPFALGYMNTGKAIGTVTIADAYTFGLDISRIEGHVRKWANKNREFLRNYEPYRREMHFLRVVSRVYLTGRVNVTIRNEETTDTEATYGAESLAKPTEEAEEINKSIKSTTKGIATAKFKIVTATTRSVSLVEEFDRPLVIGYVGFDMPILKGGRIGAPISTLAHLTKERTVPTGSPKANVYKLAALSHMHEALLEIEGTKAERLKGQLDRLGRLLPKRYPFSFYEFTSSAEIVRDTEIVAGARIEGDGFEAVLDFLGYAEGTIETLRLYLATAPRETQEQQESAALEQELQSAQTAYDKTLGRLISESALIEAIDFVFFGI